MKRTISNIIIFLLIFPFNISAQEGKKNYAQIKKEGLKKLGTIDNAFYVFEGEIFERDSFLINTFPNGEKLVLGNAADMKAFNSIPNILTDETIKKLIKKQKVFLSDGKLHEGYLFNLNHEELATAEEKEIIIANYSGKVFSLKKNGIGAISKYPHNPSGLVYFNKPLEDFPDFYIRIIIPGYATTFVDKNTIEDIPPDYDTNTFEKYTVLIEGTSKDVLYKEDEGVIYKWDKESIKGVKLSDGVYPIEYPTENTKFQFNILTGKADKEILKEEKRSFVDLLNFWYLFAIIGFGVLTALLVWNRRRLLGIFQKKREPKENESNSDSFWGGEPESEEYVSDSQINKETTSDDNETSSRSLKKITKEITKKVEESQKEIEGKIEKLRREINSNGGSEIQSLRKQLQLLESDKRYLITEKEGLNKEVLNLNETNKKNQERLELLTPKIERFEKQSIFIENYHAQIDKLITFFNYIKNIENQIIEDINSETNDTIKKFQSVVLAKYFKNNLESKFNEWDIILATIKNNEGLIVDKKLIHEIASKTSDDDKLDGIEWIIVNDVITSKINALLIIQEELSNTAKIAGRGSDISNDNVATHKADLISKMKQLFGIKIDNVTLFSDFQSYSNIKSTQEKVSYDLSLVTLKMGDIKEIKTYGMKLKDKKIETIVIEE